MIKMANNRKIIHIYITVIQWKAKVWRIRQVNRRRRRKRNVELNKMTTWIFLRNIEAKVEKSSSSLNMIAIMSIIMHRDFFPSLYNKKYICKRAKVYVYTLFGWFIYLNKKTQITQKLPIFLLSFYPQCSAQSRYGNDDDDDPIIKIHAWVNPVHLPSS